MAAMILLLNNIKQNTTKIKQFATAAFSTVNG